MGTGRVINSCEGYIFLNKKYKSPTTTDAPVFTDCRVALYSRVLVQGPQLRFLVMIMSRLNFLIRSSSSTILVLIPLAFHSRILRQPLLLTSAFLDWAAWRRSSLATPLLFALVEQFSQCQEPVDMCILCSPLDILEQLLWQVRRHPMQTSGWGEYLTTFSHCRHS